MKVIVKAGKAWINGYYYENDSDLILLIENADGVLNRIDRVVLRLDLVEREISIQIKKGTYSSSAVAEDIEKNSDIYELAIADIKISNGVISLNNSNITDLRLNKELCGVVCGTIDEVDTTDIFNTYQYYLDAKMNSDEFNEWFTGLKNRLDPNEDAALQLQIQIDDLEKKLGDSLKTDGTVQENLNADMIDGKQADGELITQEKENLVKAINEVFTSASNGKISIANAITGKGVRAVGSETYNELSTKIGQIANDTNAVTSDILTGKTVYIQGKKANGTMANVQTTIQGSANSDAFTNNAIIGWASNEYVGAFDFNVTGYVSRPRIHIANLLAHNIREGVRIGGQNGYVTGTLKAKTQFRYEQGTTNVKGFSKTIDFKTTCMLVGTCKDDVFVYVSCIDNVVQSPVVTSDDSSSGKYWAYARINSVNGGTNNQGYIYYSSSLTSPYTFRWVAIYDI